MDPRFSPVNTTVTHLGKPPSGGNIRELMEAETELPEIVCTLHSPSGRPRLLNRWQQQRNQRSNDGDNHQQFDECKSASRFLFILHRVSRFVFKLEKQNILTVDRSENADRYLRPDAPSAVRSTNLVACLAVRIDRQ